MNAQVNLGDTINHGCKDFIGGRRKSMSKIQSVNWHGGEEGASEGISP